MLHWTLGLAALIGAIVIFVVAALNEFTTRKVLTESRQLLMQSRSIADSTHQQSESVLAMGMGKNVHKRWQSAHQAGAGLHTSGSDRAGGYTATTKAFRMFLQSGILGLGCALAVIQLITPGAMIAGSIIMGRALAPIQMAIGQWKSFVRARDSYMRLNTFFEAIPAEKDSMQLPEPKGHITVENLIAAPPGAETAVLKNISFEIKPGQGLGVIGPSASGKSTLARLLVGVWTAQRGSVRLDGATYDQWNREALGPHIGYLPQDVALFDGSIKDNIARLDDEAPDEAIVEAAKNAGVHEMILQMPNGYDTVIGGGKFILSGGQVQRIALARALYGDPKLLVLDEPNANLDNDGDNALTAAIAGSRRRGNTVIVMTHRPSAIAAVDMILMLRDGRVEDFGPKEEVIKRLQEKQQAPQKGNNVGPQSQRAPA